MRLLLPCPTSWNSRGWRAWRDRFLYGHIGHQCDHTEHVGEHACRCGARLQSPFEVRQ